MRFPFGGANSNSNLAGRLYAETFRNRRCPAKKTVAAIHQHLCERWPFKQNIQDCVTKYLRLWGSTMHYNIGFEEDVLNSIAYKSKNSARKLSVEISVSHNMVWRVLHEWVQYFSASDFLSPLQFCDWFLDQCINPNFNLLCFLQTDEAKLTRDRIMNFPIDHQSDKENPQAIGKARRKKTFLCSIWAGIDGNYLIGPYRPFRSRAYLQSYSMFFCY